MQRKPDYSPMAAYLPLGMTLIPLNRWDHVDDKGRKRGKSPRDANWSTRTYDSRAVLEECGRAGLNVGVRLSATWVVVDVDPRNFPEGRNPADEIELEAGVDLRAYPCVRTGSGGWHYYMRKPADLKPVDSLVDFPGVEFKSLGRQVVAPGSIHPDGGTYAWDPACPPLEGAGEAPAGLLRMIERPATPRQAGTGAGELSPEALQELLEQLDPEDYRDHTAWLELMMACHHGTSGDGRQEFIDWSTSDPEYADHAWTIGRRWDSLHVRRDRTVTVRTLYKAVLRGGGTIPHSRAEDDFDEVDDVRGDPVEEADPDARASAVGDAEGRVSLLDEINAEHCVVNDGGKFRIFGRTYDPVLRRKFYSRSTKSDFEDLMSNRFIEVGEKVMPVGHWWVRHPQRLQYRGVVFDPETDHPGYLNLWQGWAVEPARGDWSLLQELLYEVLCDGSMEAYEYVLNWSAAMVQRPGRPAEVAVCFRGEKGTGKGTFGRALAGLAGPHGLHISSPGHLTGRFNSHLRDCICLFADEAFWAGDKSGESVLKQLVTEPTLMYEGKGENASTGRNLIHIVMASNSEWVVPAGLDGERRFAVFEVNGRAQGDKARFQAINRQLYERGGLEAMLHDLLARNIAGWSPRDGVPQTDALLQQKLRSMDHFESWWFERVSEGFIPNQRTDWSIGPTVVLKEYLRRSYADHAKGLGVRYLHTDTQFGVHLRKLCPAASHRQVQALDSEFNVATDTKGRATAYVLPSLQDCREAFERKLGSSVSWPGAAEPADPGSAPAD